MKLFPDASARRLLYKLVRSYRKLLEVIWVLVFLCVFFSSFFLLSFPAGEGGEGKVISVSCVYSDCQEIYTEIKTSWSSFSRAGFCDDSDFQIRKV